MSVLKQIRTAAMHVRAITWKEKMDCRFSMGYQFLGSDTRDDATKQVTTGAQNVKAAADWLVDVFGYKKDSIHYVDNSGIKFHGYDSVMQSNDIGQVNAPEYERGLVDAIKRMGATVITGVKYQSHEKLANGTIDVHTDAGDLMTKTSPLLATGVGQLQSLTAGKLPIKFNGVYTGAMHIQLAPDDIKKVCPGGKPMAYCDTNLSGDVIWGSIDSQGVLTMGFGDSDKWNGDQNKIDMQNKFREILPDIADKYLNGALKNNVTYSYGTMLEAENNFPLVGRMPDYDVMVGWASRGIVQSSAAAQAYANWVVNGNDKALKPWESLQPKVFAPQPQAHATRTPKTLKA
jgi:glycine/D-amino acid oxidase-like deaminating enzyme